MIQTPTIRADPGVRRDRPSDLSIAERSRAMRRVLSLLVLSVALVGCGSSGPSGGGSSGSEPYVDAMMKSYDQHPKKQAGLTSAQVRCIAQGVVDEVGVDKLKALGVSTAAAAEDSDAVFHVLSKKLKTQAEVFLYGLAGECKITPNDSND